VIQGNSGEIRERNGKTPAVVSPIQQDAVSDYKLEANCSKGVYGEFPST
jgi:hypothetical protein